ncbi:hypothetical protein [Sorangium cellulosum]|uniref:hypothetical protein n=1 Tax=Sorangium cellulosum TaxID=56 RepID=UPI001F5E2DB2|nr:hypothetical protein [Sorangium cellulosum]
MSTEPAANKPSAAQATPGGAPPGGRLAVLTAFAVGASWIPVPVLPERMLLRIRGAIAQDTVARHGLSLTTDARAVLAQPGQDQTTFRRAAEVVTREVLRRLSPAQAVAAAARGLEVYALGHLLNRYLTRVRKSGAVRVQADEARRIRDAIDRAVRRSLSPALRPSLTILPGGAEDLRDEFTRWIDTFLLAGAAVPEYIERRLDVAFDEIVATGSPHD